MTFIPKKAKIFNPPGNIISKYNVDSGMIITFTHKKKTFDKRPIVFVLQTEKRIKANKFTVVK